MNTSVIWFRQIGSINLSRNSPTATGYDTHKYMVDRSQTVPSTAFRGKSSYSPRTDVFLRTIMIPLPDDTPSLFILVRAVKQPLLAPLFVTFEIGYNIRQGGNHLSRKRETSREEILRILIRIGQRAVNIGR